MVQTQDRAAIESQAIEATQAFAKAMKTANAEALEGLLAPDFTYVHRNARVEPREEIIPSVQGGRHYPKMEMTEWRVRQYPGTALVSGRVHMGANTPNGLWEWDSSFTAVWVQIAGEWRLVNYQGTASPDA